MTKNQKGFGVVYVLVAIVVAVAIASSLLVYNRHKEDKNSQAANSTNTSQQQKDLSDANKEQPQDAYKGWKTGSLVYEKATFKYPSDWQVSDSSKAGGLTGNAKPGSDSVVLKSSDGLEVSISSGVSGIGDGFRNVLDSSSISSLEDNLYLDFYTNDSSKPDLAQGACLGTTSSETANYPYSNNISISNSSNKPFNVVCIQYSNDSAKAVSEFKSDSSFNDAKLIVESLSY